MTHEPSTANPWLSTPRLILVAVILLLLALVVVAYPTIRFFKTTFEETLFTTAKFDANTETVVDLPDAQTRYILAAVVDDPEDPPPVTELSIRTPEGEEIEHWESNGWMSKFGDHYRRVCQFRAPESGTVVITANSAPTEDFALLRHPNDVMSHNLGRVRPWWIASAIPFLVGAALIAFVILRKIFQKDDLRLSI